MTMTPDELRTRQRNRWTLLALCALFFGGLLLAGALRFSGWRPAGMKNHGELLQPPADLRGVTPQLAAGDAYAWNPAARTWRIAAVARDCDGARARECATLLRQLDTVWQLMGKDADRVHVLWIGPLPPGAQRPATLRQLRPDASLRNALPRADDPAGDVVYVLDPNGFVVLRYAPGFDPGGLRSDLSRLLKIN
jgi:hypothetical protein